MREFYLKRIFVIFFLLQTSLVALSQFAVVTPAEFEKNEGILLVWDYSPQRDSITANIAKAAQQAGKVWIIYYPGQAPADTSQIRSYLYSRGVLPDSLYFIPALTETLWIRDFGPMVQYGNFGQETERYVIDMGYSAYNRPKDDSIPSQIANLWNWKKVNLPLELEGGNIIFDGLGRGFVSKRILAQNPALSQAMIRNILIDKFNVDDIVFLENLNNSGGFLWKHVDMWMKVLDFETILVSSYPNHLPDYPVIEANVDVLRSLTNGFGKPYNIIRIPAPPKANGNWATTQNDEMRTYTNSLIINNTVIVPSYNLPQYDQQALQIYKDAMPGYKIIMVDSRNLTPLGGAIHCITKEVPAEHHLRVVHRKITGIQAYSPEMYIYTSCSSTADIQRMWLHYKINDDHDYRRVPVYFACPQNIGIIEGLQPGDTVYYYLEAVSVKGTINYPLSAPAGNFTFWFEGGTVGEKEINAENRLIIVPQPNSGSFYVHNSREVNIEKIQIFDNSGRLVFENDFRPYELLETKLPKGFYVVRAVSLTGSFSTKMVITD